MHWDFFTVMSAVSGIVLVITGLAGPVVGPPRDRAGIFALGVFSLGYGIWVAKQNSGIYFFSAAPAVLAILIVFRVFQHAGQAKPPVAQPGSAPAVPAAGAQPTAPGAGAALFNTSTVPPGLSTPPASPAATLGWASTPSAAPAGPAVSPPAVISALRAAQPQRIRDAVHSGSEAFSPAFALLKSLGHPDSYMSQSLAVGWSMASCMPTLLSEEELLGIWQAHARVKVAVGNDLRPTAPRPGVSWVTAFDGTGFIALTDRRMVGIVLRGDGLTGTFDRDYETGIALWCMRLDHCSSVSAELVGHRPGLILSSAKPAGYATLTEISPGDVAGDQAVASSAPEHIASLIEQASARFSPSMPD